MNTSTQGLTSMPLSRLPGLLLTAAVAGLSIWLGTLPWMQNHGISALTLAIVIGIVLGNTVYRSLATRADAGVGSH